MNDDTCCGMDAMNTPGQLRERSCSFGSLQGAGVFMIAQAQQTERDGIAATR
jgi:hypothetical protein